MIRHEQETRGHALDLDAAHLLDLERAPADALLWVTFTRADALRYGSAEYVAELRLDIPAYVIATDGKGGFLLFFPDDLTQPTGGAAMADHTTHDHEDEATLSPSYTFTNPVSGATASGLDAATAVDLAAHNQGWRIVFSPGMTGDDGFTGVVTDPELGRIQLRSEDGAFVAGGATYDDLAAAISRDGGPLSLDEPAPAPARALDLDLDDEEKRRAGRGGGDIGGPAFATLAANIRPDVVSTPSGLETITTQKSADYRADPDAVDASDYIRARLAEAERSANQPTLTLEAIAADPWNAVELPIPADASKELLTAARSAAEYCAEGHYDLMQQALAGTYTPPGWTGAEGEPDAHEYDEARWQQAEARAGFLTGYLDQLAELDPVTREANEASTKRQDAERAAQSGERVPGEEGASLASDYIAGRLAEVREAKAEREAEGVELAVLERGEGNTIGGGGGRGMF